METEQIVIEGIWEELENQDLRLCLWSSGRLEIFRGDHRFVGPGIRGTIDEAEPALESSLIGLFQDPACWEHMPNVKWIGATEVLACEYTCGYCGLFVSSVLGMTAVKGHINTSTPVDPQYQLMEAYICPNCSAITYRDNAGHLHPQPLCGANIEHLSEKVASIYSEARQSMQARAHTGVILLCRSLLTHVAEEQGAPKGTFNQAVEFLDKEGYIPRNAKPGLIWIKDKGNESAHDLVVFNYDEAKRVMEFTAFMLKVIYEFPKSVPSEP